MKKLSSNSRLLKSLTAISFAVTAMVSTASAVVSGLPLFYYTGIDLGAGGFRYSGQVRQWAIIATNGSITATASNGSFAVPTISGDVAVNPGSLSISGNAYVYGHAYIRSGGGLIRSGLARLDGSNTVSPTQAGLLPTPYVGRAPNVVEPVGPATDALVTQATADAMNASLAAAALATNHTGATATGFSLGTGVINSATNISLAGDPNAKIVLNLTDFILTGGATLTLSGNQFTSFVINVSNTFSLVGGKVNLSGGLLGGNVLFNVVNAGSATLTSGANIGQGIGASAGSPGAIILAPFRNFTLSSSSIVNGTLVARSVSLSGNSRVLKPNWVSP